VSIRSVSFKLYGQPPPKGSARSVRLSYVRRIQLRLLLFVVPIYAVVLALGFQTWLLIVFALAAAIALANIVSLSIRIRRARQREQAVP
jgi:hypothetical protein